LKPRLTVSEIAFNLVFEYPNHFTRLFKKKMGMNPTEWKSQKRGSG
ncbi:MAG: AraC family transcriptional regulator, partial [Bacteroidota bacterium]